MDAFPVIPANKISLAKRKLVFGIGINDANYLVKPKINGVTLVCPFYAKWKDMLKRCYSEKYKSKHKTYDNCFVCEKWHSFMSFRNWMKNQDWKEKSLDKDILVKGNKEYGPDFCIFVRSSVNTLINNQESKRGCLPIGVTYHKKDKVYHARMKIDSKTKYLGFASTPEGAAEIYARRKIEHIIDVARKEPDERVRDALINYANSYYKWEGSKVCSNEDCDYKKHWNNLP